MINVTTMDPPWAEKGGGKIKRGADKHYGVMKPPDILRAILRSEAWAPADDHVLVTWTTMMSLAHGMWLMDALGHRYVTHGVWVKTKADLAGTSLDISLGQQSLGQYLRGAHELFLIGVRGHGFAVKTDAKDIPSVLLAPSPRGNGKRVHSRKPIEFIEMIERRFHGPYLEMFARKGDRPNWSYWGSMEHQESDEREPAGMKNSCYRHGMAGTPTWKAWTEMNRRCSNPRAQNYKHYGGRGITVCERWRERDGFALFYKDVGERPAGSSLDRFPNNDGNYEPGNVRWSSSAEQCQNRRSNVLTEDLANEIMGRMEHGESAKSVAKRMGIGESVVSTVRTGKCWGNVVAPFVGVASRHPANVKIGPDAANEIRVLLSQGMSQADIARRFKCDPSCISRIKAGKSWRTA